MFLFKPYRPKCGSDWTFSNGVTTYLIRVLKEPSSDVERFIKYNIFLFIEAIIPFSFCIKYILDGAGDIPRFILKKDESLAGLY